MAYFSQNDIQIFLEIVQTAVTEKIKNDELQGHHQEHGFGHGVSMGRFQAGEYLFYTDGEIVASACPVLNTFSACLPFPSLACPVEIPPGGTGISISVPCLEFSVLFFHGMVFCPHVDSVVLAVPLSPAFGTENKIGMKLVALKGFSTGRSLTNCSCEDTFSHGYFLFGV